MFGKPLDLASPVFEATSETVQVRVYEDSSAFRRSEGEIPPHWRISVHQLNGDKYFREDVGSSQLQFLLDALRDVITFVDGRKRFFELEREQILESPHVRLRAEVLERREAQDRAEGIKAPIHFSLFGGTSPKKS